MTYKWLCDVGAFDKYKASFVQKHKYYKGFNVSDEDFKEEIEQLEKIYRQSLKEEQEDLDSSMDWMVCNMEAFVTRYKKVQEIKEKLELLEYKKTAQKCKDKE